MGHSYIERLPQTQEWRQIVHLIRDGTAAGRVADAVIAAVQDVLLPFAKDPGVVEATWYLLRLPLAARDDEFAVAFRCLGLQTPDEPDLMDVLAGLSDRIDETIRPDRRTDLSEIAQNALLESVAVEYKERSRGLFEEPLTIQDVLSRTATVKEFGRLARVYFGCIVRKVLDSYVSRLLTDHVGDRRRFRTLTQQREFTEALARHAREVAAGTDVYAGEWFSKWSHLSEGRIGRDEAGRFLSHAADKLNWALKRRRKP